MDLQYIILGIVQGIAEWLPISSKTALLLLSAYVFGYSLAASYDIGLALQGGTVASSTLYFWRSLARIFSEKWLLRFLLISTIVTGLIGVPLYLVARRLLEGSIDPGIPMLIIGLALIVQALLSGKTGKNEGVGKGVREIGLRDSIIFGVFQGIASLPGVSRSGITMATLLYLGYRVDDALRLSFIASIPANLGALATVALFDRETINIISPGGVIQALAISALVGYISIGVLLKLASKYRSMFTLAMGILTIIIGLAITIRSL
ncbi:MAG TPA: undecaprenyl-diphosphate phosphatase [Sulfolobales archaeon]|nr:undecaprenyl-diphosphate phosphatase [Sulfolobales archaeon]